MKTGASDESIIRRTSFLRDCVSSSSLAEEPDPVIVRYYKKYQIFYIGTDLQLMIYSS